MHSGLVATALVALYAVHRVTTVCVRPVTSWPAPSGSVPQEHAPSRFHARWYLSSIVFLAFDVEMRFMYPWAVVVLEKGVPAVVEMFLFLGALLVTLLWASREREFRWA